MLVFHIGNLYTRVDKKKATADELKLLHGLLSVKVPGFHFSPHFRRGLWDGQRKFFNLLTGTFYTGLLDYTLKKLEEHNVVWKINDDRQHIEYQNNPLSLEGITLRDYQISMVEEAIKKKRGIISAPPNAGKSECAAGIIQVLGLPANFFTHRLTLLRQTKDRFEKRLGMEVGMIGGGVEDIKDVNVVSVQSIYRKLDEPQIINLLNNTPVIICDECFIPYTGVLVDFGVAVPIKKICNSKKINYVLSYNHKVGSLEKKKITRKIIRKRNESGLISIYVEFNGKIKKITCTSNHKIYVNGSYIKANNVKVGDKVKVINKESVIRYNYSDLPKGFFCKKCGKMFLSNSIRSDAAKHHMFHYKKSSIFKDNIKMAGHIRGDQIRGENNPSKNPKVKEKIRIKIKKWWGNLSEKEREWRIKTFINAPIHKFNRKRKTSLEEKIEELKIPNLKFTGNGGKFIKFLNGRKKNPDFSLEGSNKVIEVGDVQYWHTEKEFEKLVKLYKEVGYDCLTLTTKDCYNPNLKGRILKFLFNCEGKVTKIVKRYPYYLRNSLVYNLEVEDNHNYFANNMLVSNCHHASAKTFEKCFKACPNAIYRFGLSATPLLRDEISNMVVRGLTGDEIVAITSKELIDTGISAFPSVYLLNVRDTKISSHLTFDQVYDIGILRNEKRNQLVINSTKYFLAKGKSVFILVWRIEHGEILLQKFKDEGIESEFISGGTGSEGVQEVLKRFSAKELKCVISSTISDEGLDVPAVDVLIIATGFKAPLKTIQRVGRGLRKKTSGENVVSIVDFIDWHSRKYLYKHSIDRVREYVKMSIPIFEVEDEEWKVITER